VVTASGIAEDLIRRLPGFRRAKKHFLRQKHPKHFLAYGRATTFETTTSIRQMVVLLDRRMRRLAHCKVRLIASDETGLLPEDVLSVLGLLPDARVVPIELAFDFGSTYGVTGAYVISSAAPYNPRTALGKSSQNRMSFNATSGN